MVVINNWSKINEINIEKWFYELVEISRHEENWCCRLLFNKDNNNSNNLISYLIRIDLADFSKIHLENNYKIFKQLWALYVFMPFREWCTAMRL